MTADEQRSVLMALVSEVKVSPVNRGRGGTFDPSRVTFVRRSGALAQAVGFKEDGELDHERLMEVWNSGALPKAIGWTPERMNEVLANAAAVGIDEVMEGLQAEVSTTP